MAAALSTGLLLPCLALFLVQRYAVERRGSYVTVTGKGSFPEPLPTPPLLRALLVASWPVPTSNRGLGVTGRCSD